MEPDGVQIQLSVPSERAKEEEGWPRLLTEEEVAHILAVPGNQTCADCVHEADSMTPAWASVTFGIVLSPLAAGMHRGLGTDVSRVISLRLDKWKREDYNRMLAIGNLQSNLELEENIPAGVEKPVARGGEGANKDELNAWIRAKYGNRAFTKNGAGEVSACQGSRTSTTVATEEFCGLLVVRIKSATQLVKLDVVSQSDPYVVAELGKQRFKTKRIKNTANPTWNESLFLNVKNSETDVVRLSVWDDDSFSSDDFIGDIFIKIKDVVQQHLSDAASTSPSPVAFDDMLLQGGDHHPCCCVRLANKGKVRGYLSIDLTYNALG